MQCKHLRSQKLCASCSDKTRFVDSPSLSLSLQLSLCFVCLLYSSTPSPLQAGQGMAIPAVLLVVPLGILFILSGLIVNLIQVFVIMPHLVFLVVSCLLLCVSLELLGFGDLRTISFFLSMFYANCYFQIIVIVVIIIIFLLLFSFINIFLPSRQIGCYTKLDSYIVFHLCQTFRLAFGINGVTGKKIIK